MKEINESEFEDVLENQIPDFDEINNLKQAQPEPEVEAPKNGASQFLGQKLSHTPGQYPGVDKEADKTLAERKGLSRIGDNIHQNTEIRDGWMEVDRSILGARNVFYPADWKFRIRPANVEAIKNWSSIDDENANSIDDVFNEILKTCLAIITPNGPLPWGNIRSWDRFFFILLIRQYSMINGDKKIAFDEDCVNCGNPVTFELTATSLDYEVPDSEVMHYFSPDQQNWYIDPEEYEVAGEPITLYLPTLEKDAAIKAWLISKIQAKKKIDNIFIRFLPWLAPKISKDEKIADRQIREFENQFRAWDTEMFSLMDEILKNIQVIPSSSLVTKCPVCGEEVTAEIRFPDGIRSLFAVSSRRKKFGKK